MGVFSGLLDLIKAAISWLADIVRTIIRGVLNFFKEVVGWFKSLALDKNKHVPFVADAAQFKDMLKTAPEKNVGIFEGVYDEVDDEIVNNRYLEADEVDQKTKEVLGDEPLVVLC